MTGGDPTDSSVVKHGAGSVMVYVRMAARKGGTLAFDLTADGSNSMNAQMQAQQPTSHHSATKELHKANR